MKKLIFILFSILLFAGDVFVKPGCYVCPSESAIYQIINVSKYNPTDARALARDNDCYIIDHLTKVELATEGNLNKIYIKGYGYYYTTYDCISFSK